MRFRVVHSGRKVATEDFSASRLDFAPGYHEETSAVAPGIENFDWFADDCVAIASERRPPIRRRLSVAQHRAARHVVVTPWSETRGVIGYVHNEFGRERRVAVQWPTVLAAPSIVADSDLPMTVPRHAAECCATRRRSGSSPRRSRSRATR